MHPALPTRYLSTECPMLVLQDPQVQPWLTLWDRVDRYGLGDWEQHDALDLDVLDVMHGAAMEYRAFIAERERLKHGG